MNSRTLLPTLFTALLLTFGVTSQSLAQQSGSELTVDGVSVSNATVAAGASFTINATVNNGGNAASAATTLTWYHSDNARITDFDIAITTDMVGIVAVGGSSTESASVSIATAGTYWVGACVTTVANEITTDNNCSSGVSVIVTATDGSGPNVPDMIVSRVSVSAASVDPGASFTINATVQNAGDAASAATTLTYYRSTNNAISSRLDTQIGTDPVSGLAALATSAESLSASITNAGIYWVGACVTMVANEANTGNNCSSGVQVQVGSVQPDLTVDGVSVSSASVAAGTSFTINATVNNGGTGASAATTLTWYRSADATISVGDTSIATDPVGTVAANGSSPESASVSITTTGTWWVGACVPTVADEVVTNNNCSTGVQVTVTAATTSGPNLTADIFSISDITPSTSESFTITATVRNAGSSAYSGGGTVRYYRSADATITVLDTLLAGRAFTGTINSNGQTSTVATVTIDTAGTWYIGACVGTLVGETFTNISCSTSTQVTVSTASDGPPDLIVGQIGLGLGCCTWETDQWIILTAPVRNIGTGVSPGTTVRFYRSTDRTISTSDTLLDTVSIAGEFNIRQVRNAHAGVMIDRTGTYYVGACAATVSGETETNNNCSRGRKITIITAQADSRPAGPDLSAYIPSANNRTPRPDQSFTISVTIQNLGRDEAPSARVRFYRSDDATITTADTEFTTEPETIVSGRLLDINDARWLLPGRYARVRRHATVSIDTLGNYFVGACVETVTNETDTTNNCSRGTRVSVRNPSDPNAPGPHLAIRDITVPETVAAGASFMIDVTVENRGNRASGASTLSYYHTRPWEEECEEYDEQDEYEVCLEEGPDEPTYIELDTTVAVGGLAPGAFSTHSATVSIPGPETGFHRVGVIACVSVCSYDVPVIVTPAPPPAVPEPDLTISSVSTSVSRVGIGTPFMLSATVQNAGTLATAATTLRYYRSNDATITTDDTQLATAAVAALAPDAASSQSAEVSIPDSRRQPPATTTWWVGACVDAVNDEDATNNCSSAVRVEVVTQPDLIVKDARVSDATVETGASFTVTATVENIGKRGSNHSSLHIYRSDDNTVSEDDSELAVVRNVISLPASYAANNSETYTATVSISVAGAFQIIACVIPAPSVGETDDMSNNCSNPVPVTVALPPPIPPPPPPPPPPTPDLIVENVSVTDAKVEHGASLTINATVRNRGSGASPATTLLYHISDDATITADDAEYAPRMNVGALAPGASSPQSVEITMLYPEGSYWLGACVSAVNEESATANNCSRGVQISVVVPDLTVTSVSVSDASVAAGASFIINATVQNTGGATAAATTLRYFLSGAVTIDTTDTELATTAVAALAPPGSTELATTAVATLAPAASSQQSATVSVPDAGNYWISACVDPVSNETQTSDNASNCAVGVPVTVIVPADDTDTNAALPAILQLLLEP